MGIFRYEIILSQLLNIKDEILKHNGTSNLLNLYIEEYKKLVKSIPRTRGDAIKNYPLHSGRV